MNKRVIDLIKTKYSTQKLFVSEFKSRYPDAKITDDVVTQWSTGKSESYKRYAGELAEFFGVSTDFLFFGKDGILPEDETKLLNRFRLLDELEKEVVLGKMSEMLLKKAGEKETDMEFSDDLCPLPDLHKMGMRKE